MEFFGVKRAFTRKQLDTNLTSIFAGLDTNLTSAPRKYQVFRDFRQKISKKVRDTNLTLAGHAALGAWVGIGQAFKGQALPVRDFPAACGLRGAEQRSHPLLLGAKAPEHLQVCEDALRHGPHLHHQEIDRDEIAGADAVLFHQTQPVEQGYQKQRKHQPSLDAVRRRVQGCLRLSGLPVELSKSLFHLPGQACGAAVGQPEGMGPDDCGLPGLYPVLPVLPGIQVAVVPFPEKEAEGDGQPYACCEEERQPGVSLERSVQGRQEYRAVRQKPDRRQDGHVPVCQGIRGHPGCPLGRLAGPESLIVFSEDAIHHGGFIAQAFPEYDYVRQEIHGGHQQQGEQESQRKLQEQPAVGQVPVSV